MGRHDASAKFYVSNTPRAIILYSPGRSHDCYDEVEKEIKSVMKTPEPDASLFVA